MSNRMWIKGFTLVELLAVLLILAILVLITTPIVLNVVIKANENAFLDTAYSIDKAADNYYTSLATSGNSVPLLITYTESEITTTFVNEEGNVETTSENYLNYTGRHPYSGNVYISAEGEVEMAIYDNRSGICVTKGANDKSPEKSDIDESNCKLSKTIP